MAQKGPSERAIALRTELFEADLSLDDVAYILDLDRTTVSRLLREGALVGFRVGRAWRIPEKELRAYAGALRRRSTPAPPLAHGCEEG